MNQILIELDSPNTSSSKRFDTQTSMPEIPKSNYEDKSNYWSIQTFVNRSKLENSKTPTVIVLAFCPIINIFSISFFCPISNKYHLDMYNESPTRSKLSFIKALMYEMRKYSMKVMVNKDMKARARPMSNKKRIYKAADEITKMAS